MAASRSADDVVIIKKYANRRLYDTESSTYITLERLAEMVRQKRDFKVVDAKTGEDITRSVLTQIIMDEEARGATMLPVNFLRQLIGMYGDQMQAVVPQYLEASLDALQRNQSAASRSDGRRLRRQSVRRDGAAQHGDVHRGGRRQAGGAGKPAPAERQQGRAGGAQGRSSPSSSSKLDQLSG